MLRFRVEVKLLDFRFGFMFVLYVFVFVFAFVFVLVRVFALFLVLFGHHAAFFCGFHKNSCFIKFGISNKKKTIAGKTIAGNFTLNQKILEIKFFCWNCIIKYFPNSLNLFTLFDPIGLSADEAFFAWIIKIQP